MVLDKLRGEMRLNESMINHTSWKAGGNAQRFYRPSDTQDLIEFLKQIPEHEPLEWIGLGSNLLVRDGGFDGTVIHTRGCMTEIKDIDSTHFVAEAGTSCAVAARHAARKGLVGLEFFAGIPGTVGGALAMNAGAFGAETWERVAYVEMINRNGEVTKRLPEEFNVAYRQVGLPVADEWFLSACFNLEAGDTEQAQKKIKQLLEQRSSSQPIGLASCGSTFRNPKNDYAARLIEQSGLKGKCIGDACVSEKHANFVINQGKASARDIEQLVEKIETTVFEKTGVRLEREFHIIGKATGGSR